MIERMDRTGRIDRALVVRLARQIRLVLRRLDALWYRIITCLIAIGHGSCAIVAKKMTQVENIPRTGIPRANRARILGINRPIAGQQ